MKTFYLSFSLLLLFTSPIVAGDLEEMYKSPETRDVPASKFVETFPNFKWQGANKRVAISKKSSLFEQKVREAIAYFNASGKLTRLDAWVYNRGDDGPKSKEVFEDEHEKLRKKLAKYFGVREPSRKAADGAVKAEAYPFALPNRYEVKLLVGFEKRPKYRADFLNLIMRNYSDKDRLRGSSAAMKFIKKESNGDVIIDKIPMIDQGPKGYCVPATMARVGQHFGVDISMHEVAMIADSTSSGGTSVSAAIKAIKSNYGRVKLNIRDIRIKNPFKVYVRRGNTLSPNTPQAAQAAFSKLEDDDRAVLSFLKEIKKQIDKGYIVGWSMVVGLLPENGKPARQGGGGHMRMIIGYNEKTREIIFSDSWGNGHEIKRIDLKAALLVSNGIYQIIP